MDDMVMNSIAVNYVKGIDVVDIRFNQDSESLENGVS